MEHTAAAQTSGWRALVRRPGYPGFVLTVSLSRVASAMFTTSGVLLVLARTGSASLSGATAAAATLPGAISGPLLGAWLDVARRKRVLVVVDQLCGSVALLAMVALAGHAPGWTLPAAAVLYSLTRPFSSGSFMSAVAEVAGIELVDRASAVEATSLNMGFIVGPALAGALAGAFGPARVLETQAAIGLVVAALVARNPAFEARPAEQASSLLAALRDGTRGLMRHVVLRRSCAASVLGNFGWSLMIVTFPLYARRELHAPEHASGYLWAALAFGSILGTFVLAGTPSPRRVGLSYLAVGATGLLWPLAGALGVAIALVLFTGFTEGPAYSGTIALRQRLTPPAVRGQVMNTVGSLSMASAAAGGLVGGLLHDPTRAILLFAAVMGVAGVIIGRTGLNVRSATRDPERGRT